MVRSMAADSRHWSDSRGLTARSTGREWREGHWECLNLLKPQSQSPAIHLQLPHPFQTLSPSGDQVFRYVSLWGPCSFQSPQRGLLPKASNIYWSVHRAGGWEGKHQLSSGKSWYFWKELIENKAGSLVDSLAEALSDRHGTSLCFALPLLSDIPVSLLGWRSPQVWFF